MRRRWASDLRSLLLRGHGAVVDEADELGEVDEERARVNAESGSHNLDAPLPGAPKMSGETVLHEHLWDRSPFVRSARGRREHEEQIVASTRAVYQGSGRGGRVKPYSCLVVIQLESSGAGSASYTERTSDLGCECLNPPPPFLAL